LPATNQDSLVVSILKNLIKKFNRVTLQFFLNKSNSSRKREPFEKRFYPKEFINQIFQDRRYQSILISSWQVR